jgi:uncharacterized protein
MAAKRQTILLIVSVDYFKCFVHYGIQLNIVRNPMIINRTLAREINHITASFPVLLVTGPRQVGKTTLLETCAESNRKYVSLDDLVARQIAQEDPSLFLQRYAPPVLIDEIQYAPQLFSAIKIEVDRQRKPGMG